MRFTFQIFLFMGVHLLYAQQMDRVRATIDTLSSYTMGGRGACGEGDKKAASYLADRFSGIGLRYANDQYYQYFFYDINTFPVEPVVLLDGKTIKAGYDFIPDPSMPVVNRKYRQHFLDSTTARDSIRLRKFISKASPKKILVFNESYQKALQKKDLYVQNKVNRYGAQVILRNKKLTLGLSGEQDRRPAIDAMQNCWNFSAKRIQLNVQPKLIRQYQSANIAGFIAGTKYPDSILVVTAHYDHLGRMGDSIYFPGANDNATGVSMMLELAEYYTANPPEYTIWFIAFGAEEAGLIGSKYFTEHPLFPLRNVRFLINLDLLGSGSEGMMAVNGSVFNREFALLEKINSDKSYLTAVKKRGKAANSDHYFFSEKGVPAFFFYTLGGGTAYHDVHDVPSALTLSHYTQVFGLLKDFIKELQ